MAYRYEYSAGAWRSISQKNGGNLHFYLSTSDSLKKFLNGLVPSSYGWGNDTCWVKTWDGNTPQVHIFHEGNFIRGSYVTVRDWDCRNVGYAVEALSGSTYTNMIVRNISTHNTPSVAIFLTGNYVDCVVDSCTVDSTGYTAIYDQFGRNNAFRYDTVTNAVQTIMGCPINGARNMWNRISTGHELCL